MDRSRHFERLGAAYAGARPPYPAALYELLAQHGVIGPRRDVVEVGAGTGEASRAIVAAGSRLTAVEPGPSLAVVLHERVPEASVLRCRLEEAPLPDGGFDAAVAATSFHWVDPAISLPLLHRALRRGGWLAVWRTVYGNPRAKTPFRDRVDAIVAKRGEPGRGDPLESSPTMTELEAGGWFAAVGTWQWDWSVDLTPQQVGRLFATFSNWTDVEVDEAEQAARDCGPTVTEHYLTVLHLLRRSG